MYVLDYRSRRLYPSVSETRLYDFTKSHLQEVRQAKQDAAKLDRASHRLLCLFVLNTEFVFCSSARHIRTRVSFARRIITLSRHINTLPSIYNI